jgi:hypothetical protein
MTTFKSCKVWIDLGPGLRNWDEGEAEYTAYFDYSPGRPGVHTMRNGDPGYPDDPPELYVINLERNGLSLPVIDADGDGLLTDDQYEKVEQQCWDFIAEQNAAADAGEYEAWAQQQAEASEFEDWLQEHNK